MNFIDNLGSRYRLRRVDLLADETDGAITINVYTDLKSSATKKSYSYDPATGTQNALDQSAVVDDFSFQYVALKFSQNVMNEDMHLHGWGLSLSERPSPRGRKSETGYGAASAHKDHAHAHGDLTGVTADQHHAEAHSVASHNDTTATGAELETLTDGSDDTHALPKKRSLCGCMVSTLRRSLLSRIRTLAPSTSSMPTCPITPTLRAGLLTLLALRSGEILKWNGTAWVNNTLAEAGIAAAAHTHTESDITDLGTYLENVVEDTTPQLGGDLDMNGNDITDSGGAARAISKSGSGQLTVEAAGGGLVLRTASGNGDVTIDAHGTGDILLALASIAAGDLIYSTDVSGTLDRLGIGTAGQILQVNSGATAPEWTEAPTGAAFSELMLIGA
jgi:hypothetical protein